MTDEEYIRAAVELAYGFSYTRRSSIHKSSLHVDYTGLYKEDDIPDTIKDALAAQLISQCLELGHSFSILATGVRMRETSEHDSQTITLCTKYDSWVMNALKVIVDSGVLK